MNFFYYKSKFKIKKNFVLGGGWEGGRWGGWSKKNFFGGWWVGGGEVGGLE